MVNTYGSFRGQVRQTPLLIGLQTTSSFPRERAHFGGPFQLRVSKSTIAWNTTVARCKFCSVFHPFSPAASLPTKCRLDSHTDSKTVHYKPPPVYGQVIGTCRKSLVCSFKDKKDKHLNHSTQQTVIQRQYTFFCPKTSRSVWTIACLWKVSLEISNPSPTQPCSPDQHHSPSDTLAPTAPKRGTKRDAHLRLPGSPMVAWELYVTVLPLLGVRDWHTVFCSNTEATSSVTSLVPCKE